MSCNNMNMEMRNRLRDDGVGDGENAVGLVSGHRSYCDLLRTPSYRCYNLRVGHQEMFHMSCGYYQGVAQKDRGMVQKYAGVGSDFYHMRIVRTAYEFAEGTRHG